MPKIAANTGAIYLNETAVPIDKYLTDIKKSSIEVAPTTDLKISSLLLFPKYRQLAGLGLIAVNIVI